MNNYSKTLLVVLVAFLSLLTTNSFSQEAKKNKVLFVVTSHNKMGDTDVKTGLWIEEFATPYYYLIDQGVEVTIASPKGGQPPIDPKSESPDFQTEATKRFFGDKETQQVFGNTLKIKDVDPEEYDAVFYPGGHGPLWDLAKDKNSTKLIENFYEDNKPVAFVCHGPAALKNAKDRNGNPLVKGKKVTGFTNTEEAAVQLSDVVPFLISEMLTGLGGIYQSGNDWSSFAVEDGLLITGQNPQSSELVAQMLLQKIQ